MKKLILSILLAVSANSAFSGPADSIFWEAKSDNKVIYILGVIHFPVDPSRIQKMLDEKIERSERYVTETKLLQLAPDAAREAIQKIYAAPGSPYIKDLLNDKECSGIINKESYLEQMTRLLASDIAHNSLEFRARAIEHVLFSYGPTVQNTKSPISNGVVLENSLRIKAVRSGAAIDSLDPEFWASLDKLSNSENCHLLTGMLHGDLLTKYASGSSDYENLQQLWNAGDSKGIYNAFLHRSDSDDIGYTHAYAHWLSLRNNMMVDKIESLSKNSKAPVFVAIGAAHLAGESGVLQILRNHGFLIEPIDK